MSSANEIYNTLFAGRRLEIRLADKKAFESLRVSLAKQHQHTKLLLELTDDALCASYSEGIGTFWLGKARKAAKRVSFTIISDTDVNDAQI